MGGDTSTGRQDALGKQHAAKIVWRGFLPHQDDLIAEPRFSLRFRSGKYNVPRGGAGARGEAMANALGFPQGFPIKDGDQKRIYAFRRDLQERGLLVHEPFPVHFHGDAHGGKARTLAVSRLQHKQAPVLDGEFEVLHISEMALEAASNLLKFCEGLRHFLGEQGDGLGRT